MPVARYADYRKWLRYYLDFRSTYPLPDSKSEQVRLFIEKLQKENQLPEQQKQAAHALSLFFESQLRKKQVSSSQAEATTPTCSPLSDMQQPQRVSKTEPAIPQQTDVSPRVDGDLKTSAPQSSLRLSVPPMSAGKRCNEWRCLDKSDSPDWDMIIDNLAAEIKLGRLRRRIFLVAPSTDALAGRLYKVGIGGG